MQKSIKMEAHKFSLIYDKLEEQPHLQELISEQVWKLFEKEDKDIWRDNYKHNNDLLTIEWKIFIECEMDVGEGLHGSDCNTKEAAASNIIHYLQRPGDKISPIGYDLGIAHTETINNLPNNDRKRIIMELEEEDRLHCFY